MSRQPELTPDQKRELIRAWNERLAAEGLSPNAGAHAHRKAAERLRANRGRARR